MARPGTFTVETARAAAQASVAVRRAKAQRAPPEPEPAPVQILEPLSTVAQDNASALARVLKQLESIDLLMDNGSSLEPKQWDMLSRAKERLAKIWFRLAGIPGEGNRRPGPERTQSRGYRAALAPTPVEEPPVQVQPVQPSKPLGWEYDDPSVPLVPPTPQ